MKLVFIFFLALVASCSTTREPETTVPAEASPGTAKEGVLDEMMKNKECGLLDVFYDGCKKIYSDAEKSYYKKKAEEEAPAHDQDPDAQAD